jgi:phage-related protein
MLGGKNMATYRSDINSITGAMQSGKNGVMGWSLVQQDFNFKLDQAKAAFNVLMITIGTKLLPIIGQIVGAVTPVISNFGSWISQGDNLRNVLIAVGIVIAALLVPAVWSLAAGVIAATWPFLLIGLAIAGVVLIFKHFYETNAGFKAFIDNIVHGLQQAASFVQANFMPAMRAMGAFFQSSILPVLQSIGQFLLSTFAPVWQQLVSVWQGQILPALQQLWGALQQLAPVFQAIGGLILGLVVVAFGVLWGLITGLVKALAGVLSGLATFIGGIVQFFSGLIQIVAGVLRFLYDLVTGNFKNLGNDLHGIWTGIVTMFTGVWNMIKGAFQAAIGFVVGLVTGFVQGVIGFFQHLASMIVGHSIVPDMLNAIKNVFQAAVSWLLGLVSGFVTGVINFFSNLWHGAVNIWNMLVSNVRAILMSWIVGAIGLVTGFVNNLQQAWNSLIGIASSIFNNIKNTILGVLQNMIGAVFQAGANIVQGIANGIKSAIGAVGDAIGAVGSFISSHLPHSPAKMGPLRDLLMQGQMISQQIGEGIKKGTPHVQAALNATLAPTGSFALQAPSSSVPQSFNLQINLDSKVLTEQVGVRVAREIRLQGARNA